MSMKVIAIFPQGLEKEGANELLELGATSIKIFLRAVSFQVDITSFYRIHLKARLPFRFLREISQFPCNSPHALYAGVQRACEWEQWLDPTKTFCVDVSGSTSGLTHTHYTALAVKNALVDLQRSIWGKRSSINLEDPDVCIHLHLSHEKAALSFSSTRFSLHRRGYRPGMGLAPLKENLAAGLIRLTHWDQAVPLIDPLCGSGTLLLEAASMLVGSPNGFNTKLLFKFWPDFDRELWESEKNNANQVINQFRLYPKLIGCEQNKDIALQARSNISLAGFKKIISIQNTSFKDLLLPLEKGIIVCNPPYGKRIGEQEELYELYKALGCFLKTNASGWQLWILSGNTKLTKALHMKSVKRIPINNGGIDCRWMHYPIN